MRRTEYRFISFGSWRFFLAFLVVISHLNAHMIDGYAAYAVWGFYCLSGYLMTYILKHKYGYSLPGLKGYAWNRFLRIVPLYWCVTVFSIMTIYVLTPAGVELAALNPFFGMPPGLEEWFYTVFLIPGYWGMMPVPVATALAVEWGTYFLVPFMARSRAAAFLGVILGWLVNCNYGMDMSSFIIRYASFLPSFFAFSVGALVAHYINYLRRFAAPALSWLVWVLHGLVWLWFDTWPWTYGLYISVFLSAWVIVSMDCDRNSKVDRFLGDLSYPIYLLHTTVAAWVVLYHVYDRSWTFFLWAFLFTCIVSGVLVKLLDMPLRRLKRVGALEKRRE